MDMIDKLLLIGAVFGAIATIGGVIVAAFRWGKKILHWTGTKLIDATGGNLPVPKETLRIIAIPGQNWWGSGKIRNKPAMQSITRWHVTNISPRPARVLRAQGQVKGSVSMYESDRYFCGRGGKDFIPPGATAEVCADFWITPPIKKEGEDLILRVTLFDQYGNQHTSEYVTLRSKHKPDA